jgi:hypothetical protein
LDVRGNYCIANDGGVAHEPLRSEGQSIFSFVFWHSVPCLQPPSFHHPANYLLQTKKADVVKPARVFDHIGLFADEPPGTTERPFV